jgi:hypothetical protein
MRTGAYLATLEQEKVSNFLQRETELLSAADEVNILYVLSTELAEPTLRAWQML